MTLNTKAILKAAAVYSAAAVLVGAAWAFGDTTGYRPWLKVEQNEFTANQFQLVMDKTQQNALANARQDFIYIEGKKDRGVELTWEEKRDFCTNARILEYPVEGCNKDGEPIITFESKATK